MESYDTAAFLSFFQPGANRLEAALAYASMGIHVFPLSKHSKEPLRGSHAVHDATTNTDLIKEWWSESPDSNIGIGLRKSCVVIVDIDPRNGGEETLEEFESRFGILTQTLTVETANEGNHYWYRVSPDFYETLADQLPKKLGPGIDLLVNGYAVAPPSALSGDKLYKFITESSSVSRAPLAWIQKVALEAGIERDRARWAEDEQWSFQTGERNVGMARIAGYFRRVGFTAEEIFFMLKVIGPSRFEDFAEIEDKEIWQTAKSIANNPPSGIRLDQVSLHLKARRAPPELDPTALHGPIGDWVRYIEPITEAHPAALLVQALTVFGNMIGARHHNDIAPGFAVEGSYHRTAIYALIVGDTARAGKGDSWDRVWELFRYVDPDYKYLTGVQTGEGILEYLADDEPDGDTTTIKHGDEEETRAHTRKRSQADRRCLVLEPEFGRVLHVAERKGSVVKDILREVWDKGESGKVTASTMQRITEATLSLVGHITRPELERDYDAVDFMNGFGNRFLYCFATRTKRLLTGEARPLKDHELRVLGEPLIDALEFAQTSPDVEDMEFTEPAADLWDFEIDEQLYKNHPSDTIDALTQRGRPIVRRLSVIYAVADHSDVIKVKHLRAAYAVWKYCVETAEYIFGDHIGDKDANKLYVKLSENKAGLRLQEISRGVFQGNKSAAQIKRAIKILSDRGLIYMRKEKQGRKTVEVFFIKPEV